MDINDGLLMYIKSGGTHHVPVRWNDVRAIVQQRNRIASYLLPRSPLPEMLQNISVCGRCNVAALCTVAHRASEGGTAASSGIPALFEAHAGGLSRAHLDFLDHWLRLVDLEQDDMTKAKKAIWCLSSATGRDRESNTLAGMSVVYGEGAAGRSNEATVVTFRRTRTLTTQQLSGANSGTATATNGGKLTTGQLAVVCVGASIFGEIIKMAALG